MKKISIYSFLMLFTFFSCKQESEKKTQSLTMGQLTISNEHPQPGKNLDLVYASEDEIEAFYAYMVGENNYPLDIDFSESDGQQKASIKIPDSAVAFAVIIKADDTYDANDKKGYLVALYTENGEQISGSKSALSYFAITDGRYYDIKGDAKQTMEILKTDLNSNPGLKSTWEVPYLQLVYKNDKSEREKLVRDYLDSLSKKTDPSELEYASMMHLYDMMGQQTKYDSINAVTVEKFPKGSAARNAMYMHFDEETDLDKKSTILTNYLDLAKADNTSDFMASTLAKKHYELNDMTNFEKYLSMVDDKINRASTLNSLAWPLAESGKNLDSAEKMSKQSVDLIISLQKNPELKSDYSTKNQYLKSLDSRFRMFADTYALILFKQDKVKEAITYQEKAQGPKADDPEANQRYIEYLLADNQYELVKNKSENFIKSGHGTAKIKEAFKTAYLKGNPSATDVEDKLAVLDEAAYNKQVADIKKTMLDEEAPAFTLKDMAGTDVSLASLKGKTVILDFWATWCGPCKASFPGMQEVVTKYKDNDKVVLLFVDTFERGATRKKMVEDFIKRNNYDFHVVYDSEIEGTRDFEVAGKYDITGIPTKVIIGPDGRVKFKSVGYSGSNEKLIKEMDIMIDILKS